MKRFSITIIALVLIGYLMISVDSADPDESEFHYYYICGNKPLVYKYKDHLIYIPEAWPDGWNLIEEDDFGWTYQTGGYEYGYDTTREIYIEKISNRISFGEGTYFFLENCEVEKTLSKK